MRSIFDAEPIKECSTPREMRAEIQRQRQWDPLVANVYCMAESGGLYCEDKYVVLAYHLLVNLRKLQDRERQMLLTEMLLTEMPLRFIPNTGAPQL